MKNKKIVSLSRSKSYTSDIPAVDRSLTDKLIAFMRSRPLGQKMLDFIERNATIRYGFQGVVTTTKDGDEAVFIPTEFFSTMIMALLLDGEPTVSDELRSGINTLLTQKHRDGIFNFFSFEHPMLRGKALPNKLTSSGTPFPDDVDCTAVGASVIFEELPTGLAHSVAEKIIGNTVVSWDPDGADTENASNIPAGFNPIGVIQVYFEPRGRRGNRLDPIVCINALHFLSMVDTKDHRTCLSRTQKSLEYVYYHLANDDLFNAGTRYYVSPDAFLFFLHRLLSNSPSLNDFTPNPSQKPLGKLFQERALERINGESIEPLDVSFQAIVGRSLGLDITRQKEVIVKMIADDGGAPFDGLYRCGSHASYFGSRALVTGAALRALDFGRDIATPKEAATLLSKTDYPGCMLIEQSDEVMEEVKADYDSFATFLGSKQSKTWLTVRAYVQKCSPIDATPKQLKIASRYLSLFYFLNRGAKESSNYTKLLDQFFLTLTGRAVSKPTINDDFIDSAVTFRNQSKPSFDLLEEFKGLIESMKIEQAALTDTTIFTTYEDYEQFRIPNSSVRIWANLWFSLAFPDIDISQFSEKDGILDKLSKVIFLINDQFRVRGEDKLDAISIAMRTGYSEPQARIELLGLHNAEFKEFIKSLDTVASPETEKAIHFLKSICPGNLSGLRELPRYK